MGSLGHEIQAHLYGHCETSNDVRQPSMGGKAGAGNLLYDQAGTACYNPEQMPSKSNGSLQENANPSHRKGVRGSAIRSSHQVADCAMSRVHGNHASYPGHQQSAEGRMESGIKETTTSQRKEAETCGPGT